MGRILLYHEELDLFIKQLLSCPERIVLDGGNISIFLRSIDKRKLQHEIYKWLRRREPIKRK